MALLSDPVRFSHLKNMALSPAHYRASVEIGREDSPSMRGGRLVHALLLGGHYVVWAGRRQGKAWDEFAAAHKGEDVVTAAELARAERCAEAVRAHPEAAALLEGRHEVPLEWDYLGRRCKGRLDVLGVGVADLKTTRCAEPGRFRRDALRMAYHAQLAWYLDGAIANGYGVDGAHLIAVEPIAPFAVTVLRVTDRALDEGRKLIRIWFEQLLACEASNVWPGYCQSVVDLDVVEDAGIVLDIDGEEIAA